MQIAELSPHPQSEWAERALELLPESLVHFMHRTRYRKIYGALDLATFTHKSRNNSFIHRGEVGLFLCAS
jgi:hypothetical protein